MTLAQKVKRKLAQNEAQAMRIVKGKTMKQKKIGKNVQALKNKLMKHKY